jgi:hypothetical protein
MKRCWGREIRTFSHYEAIFVEGLSMALFEIISELPAGCDVGIVSSAVVV